MGPIAPKDPVKKRDFYFTMLEKQISVMPFGDNGGASIIYQNDGRLISASKIVGNITDESMLALLRTTEGFRKLIYGIGVSMMCSETDGADFVYQMYGKTDVYGTGTVIRQHISADGVEYLIPLNEVDWSDDDKEPGQIRFEFSTYSVKPVVNVRFYLNDGFKAPEFEGVDKVDTSSAGYREMVAKSMISSGNNYRLVRAINKARSGEKITVSFIGGSITQGAGAAPINTECYAYKTWEGICRRYGVGDNIDYVKAGVGGTPSELGMLRYDHDVLFDGASTPDIVVIEFAVNDSGDETGGHCFESLVRKALNGPGEPAVILIFSVFADDYNLQDRLMPIGEHYNLPMVSLKNAVTPQFYLSRAEGRILAKSSYFYDCYHPTNIGHTIMADSLLYVIDRAVESGSVDEEPDYRHMDCCMNGDFEDVHTFEAACIPDDVRVDRGSFDETDTQLQACEMNKDMHTTPQFPHNAMHRSGNAPYVLDAVCRHLLIIYKDSHSNDVGRADVLVDGELVRTINPREIGWVHCNPYIIIRGTESRQHHVEIRMHEGEESKEFTILGFGIVR